MGMPPLAVLTGIGFRLENHCDTTPVDKTGVNLPCHVMHVKPGCGVTMLVTVAVGALESFRLVKRRLVSRFKNVF